MPAHHSCPRRMICCRSRDTCRAAGVPAQDSFAPTSPRPHNYHHHRLCSRGTCNCSLWPRHRSTRRPPLPILICCSAVFDSPRQSYARSPRPMMSDYYSIACSSRAVSCGISCGGGWPSSSSCSRDVVVCNPFLCCSDPALSPHRRLLYWNQVSACSCAVLVQVVLLPTLPRPQWKRLACVAGFFLFA